MSTADIIIAYLMLALIPISITLGIINLLQFRQFSALRQHEFLQKRKPTLIIVYCVIALISSLFTLPYISFVHILSTKHNLRSASPIEWLNNIPETARNSMTDTGWILQFIHEISTCFLLILIAIRSWCLYVDYKFAIASSSFVNWRIHVNASETNIWIKYKKYLANVQLILRICAILSAVILLIFIILHYTINLNLYGFMADFTIAIPISIFIFWLYSQIRDTNDRYMIKYELKRLSICVLIIIFSFLTWIIKEAWIDTYHLYNADTVDIHLLMYIIDTVFVFCTVYFQTAWVIQQAHIHKLLKGARHNKSGSNIPFGSTTTSTKSFSKKHNMVDVLRSKHGFNAFVNHCVSEINVEGLLFLVEVSQFKATILQYNRNLLEALNVDVATENIHRLLLEEIFQEKGMTQQQTHEDTEISARRLSRVNSLRKRVSAMVKGMPGISTISVDTEKPSIPSLVAISASTNMPSTSANLSPIHSKMVDHCSDPTDKLPNVNNKLVMRQHRSNTETFHKFQEDILDRDWLPISASLRIAENPENVMHLEVEEVAVVETLPEDVEVIPNIHKIEVVPGKIDTFITPPPSNHGTPISTSTQVTPVDKDKPMRFSQLRFLNPLSIGEVHPNALSKLQFRNSTSNSPHKMSASKSSPVTTQTPNFTPSGASITPRSMKKQNSAQFPRLSYRSENKNDDEELKESKKGYKKMALFKSMLKSKSGSSVEVPELSPKWMFERLHDLFTKYIEISGDLSVNLSSDTRHALVSFFNLSSEQWPKYIRNLLSDELTAQENELIASVIDYETLLMRTFLYHSFDIAFDEVWALIRDDVFLRFSSTQEYHDLNLSKVIKNKSKSRTSSRGTPRQSPRNSPIVRATPVIIEIENIDTPEQKPVVTGVNCSESDINWNGGLVVLDIMNDVIIEEEPKSKV